MMIQDWYEGTLHGITGFFPANHVRILKAEEKVDADGTVKKSQSLVL
jgi:hypothetical protein